MSNRVIHLGGRNVPSERQNSEIYIDLNMTSKPSIRTAAKGETPFHVLGDCDGSELTDEQYNSLRLQTAWHKATPSKSDYLIDRSVNVRAVQNSIDNIFSWIPGERVLDPEFGTGIYALLYEGITSLTEERIVADIKNSIQRCEPRVINVMVSNPSSTDDTENNTIRLEIHYQIRGLEDIRFRKTLTVNTHQ